MNSSVRDTRHRGRRRSTEIILAHRAPRRRTGLRLRGRTGCTWTWLRAPADRWRHRPGADGSGPRRGNRRRRPGRDRRVREDGREGERQGRFTSPARSCRSPAATACSVARVGSGHRHPADAHTAMWHAWESVTYV